MSQNNNLISKNLQIINLNINSLMSMSRRYDLQQFINLQKPDIAHLSETKLNPRHKLQFVYPPQRGYISFVNTFVTTRNNDLGPYVPWRHLISAKF